MYLMHVVRHGVLALCLGAGLAPLIGCEDGREVKMPVVTEESLTPEQKAQRDYILQSQAAAMKGGSGPIDPMERAKQIMEAEQAAGAAGPESK